MNILEAKRKIDEMKATERKAIAPIECDGVKPDNDSDLDGLELCSLNGVADSTLFLIADVAYRTAGIRTSRLVQSDPQKEIGGLIAYLLDGDAKNARQRKEWLKVYVTTINRLVQLNIETGVCSSVVDAIRDLKAESAEEAAYRLLKAARGSVAAAIEAAKKEGRDMPKWVFNRALEKLTAEIFAKMA